MQTSYVPCSFQCISSSVYYGLSQASTTCTNGVLSAQTCYPACPLTIPTPPGGGSYGNCSINIPVGTNCSIACGAGYGLNAPYTSCSTSGNITLQQVCVPLLTSNTYVTYSFSAISCSPWGLVVDSGNNLVITCQNANVYRFRTRALC